MTPKVKVGLYMYGPWKYEHLMPLRPKAHNTHCCFQANVQSLDFILGVWWVLFELLGEYTHAINILVSCPKDDFFLK